MHLNSKQELVWLDQDAKREKGISLSTLHCSVSIMEAMVSLIDIGTHKIRDTIVEMCGCTELSLSLHLNKLEYLLLLQSFLFLKHIY